MDAEKLKWCGCQKKGLKIGKLNDNLAREYIQSSEETLGIMQDLKGKSNMWLATTKYYCEYFAVYALLQKLGITCEIHDCTIELCGLLERLKILPAGCYKRLEFDKDLRIDNQYYLKNRKVDLNFNELREFVLTIKDKLNSITLDEKNRAREEIARLIK